MLYTISAVAYRLFEPDSTYTTSADQTYLDYNSLKEYLVSTGEGAVHYLYFYSADDDTSVYVKNTVITSVENMTSLQFTRILETVDITELDREMKTNKLAEDWGITSYPAFAAIVMENGVPVVKSKLEYTKDHPLTAQDVVTWLQENGLYTGTLHQ